VSRKTNAERLVAAIATRLSQVEQSDQGSAAHRPQAQEEPAAQDVRISREKIWNQTKGPAVNNFSILP
jgi:hypothetical protein